MLLQLLKAGGAREIHSLPTMKTTNALTPHPILTGLGLDGEPVSVRPGDMVICHIIHAEDCPGGKGHPDLCDCTPDVRFEIIRRAPELWKN